MRVMNVAIGLLASLWEPFKALFGVATWIALGGFSLIFVLHEFGFESLDPYRLNFLVGAFVGAFTIPLSIPLLIFEGVGRLLHLA